MNHKQISIRGYPACCVRVLLLGCVVWQGLSRGKGSSKLSGQLCLIRQFIYLFSNVFKAKIMHFSTIKEMVCFTRIFFSIRQTKNYTFSSVTNFASPLYLFQMRPVGFDWFNLWLRKYCVLMLWLNDNYLAKKTNLD